MKKFDKKFGESFLKQVSTSPGVYRIFNNEKQLIYVGKAKNLRRRLSQYRNAKRRKRHYKMRMIVQEAVEITFEACNTELEAFLTENRIIREYRPKWNTAGAFSFLYPVIGTSISNGRVNFCYTTSPELLRNYTIHGAYRSRMITGQAFISLMSLLRHVAHLTHVSKSKRKNFHHYTFRMIDPRWLVDLDKFFSGKSSRAMEDMVLALAESKTARKKKKEVQEHLNSLKKFWRFEASILSQAINIVHYQFYPVPQAERDELFLRFRNYRSTNDRGSVSNREYARVRATDSHACADECVKG